MPRINGAAIGFTPAYTPHPLDAFSWNDRIWTPEQAENLINSGYNYPDMVVYPKTIRHDGETRGVIAESLNGGQARWPGNTDGIENRDHLVVPYRFNGNDFTQFAGAREMITAAMDKVSNEYMNGCIRWVDDTQTQAHSHWINVEGDPNGGCVSFVGYLGGFFANGQGLNLAPGDGVGDGCLHDSVITHEFLHAMGMNHEQERPDRDQHVIIHFDNIQPGAVSNFERMEVTDWFDMGSAYDFQSVMHYSGFQFQTQAAFDAQLPTITDHAGNPKQWPRVNRMSSEDAFQLQKMYEDFCPPLESRQCDSGEKYLKNRACDGTVDCPDGSDETEAICNATCNTPELWLSINGCSNIAQCCNESGENWLGLYTQQSDANDPNGFPLVLRVKIRVSKHHY